jgi:ABC-type branched-subunit amino acid transport system substrate-binding protein
LAASAQAPAGKVQLGVGTALTGPLAAPGVFQMNGFKLAVEEINANVGSLDKIADNNASASDEITATVIELSRVADATRSEVDKFRI